MTRSTITVLAIATTFLAVAVGAGCAAPQPTVDDGEAQEPVVASDTLVAIVSAPLAPKCTPGETRACKIFWTDSYKIHHCIESQQVCTTSSGKWSECGDLDGGVPSAPTDAPASADHVNEN